MNYKKLLATAVFTLGAWMSAGVGAQTVTYTGTGNTYSYDDGSTTTNYDISTTTYNGFNAAAITNNNPWWNKVGVADSFATEVNVRSGTPNSGGGPIFQYASNNGSIWVGAVIHPPSSLSSPGVTFAVATLSGGGVAPEMNASLIPQVGLLLGCLFLMFGRKKEVVEPMMTA